MNQSSKNSDTQKNPPKAEYIGEDPLKEAVGIWKDRWPLDMSSVEVGQENERKSLEEILIDIDIFIEIFRVMRT